MTRAGVIFAMLAWRHPRAHHSEVPGARLRELLLPDHVASATAEGDGIGCGRHFIFNFSGRTRRVRWHEALPHPPLTSSSGSEVRTSRPVSVAARPDILDVFSFTCSDTGFTCSNTCSKLAATLAATTS
jgi:hypothetical protein